MFEENIKEPLELLEKYKKYEYLLNVVRRELIESLFQNKVLLAETGSPKADIKTIRSEI
jgi:SRSO17 transposase